MKTALFAVVVLVSIPIAIGGQAADPLLARVKQERGAYLKTLQELVSSESGSRDIEGLNRLSEVIAGKLRALGGDVQFVPAAKDGIRFEDTPAEIGRIVLARFKGTGTRNILLLAHMDTVYQRGAGAKQPFRIEGDRAYGLGIEDDKQGVALILHTLAVLRAIDARSYGTLTVLINGDEEIGSPGSRALITQIGRQHHVILSCESGGTGAEDRIQLATSGNGAVLLRVTGRAAHAGEAPDQGRNALYELAHQIMQMRDLSDPQSGIKMNWTLASAGTVRNQIPAVATATADVRVQRVASWDEIERRVRERVKKTLIPDTKVDVIVERRRPPLEATDASRQLAARAQKIYAETGRTLRVSTEGSGGATDAALAALETKAPVIEGLGLLGDGAHSSDAEYILLSSLEPRLYLLARLIMSN